MSSAVEIYVIGAQPRMIETLEMTGLNHSVVIRDLYDPAEIKKI